MTRRLGQPCLIRRRARNGEKWTSHETLPVILAQDPHRFIPGELLDREALASSTASQLDATGRARVLHPVPVAVGRDEPALAFEEHDVALERERLAQVEGAVAGAFEFSKYNPFERLVMRLIAREHDIEIDPYKDKDLTDWEAVDAFARDFVARARRG